MAGDHPGWEEILEAVRTPSPKPSTSQFRAPGWHTNDADVTDFGPSRLDDDVEVVQCPDCSKVVLHDALAFHRRNCSLIRDIAEGRLSPSIIEGEPSTLGKRRGSDASDSTSASLLNGNSGGGSSGKLVDHDYPDKKSELDAKRARKKSIAARKKGITDVDTQCGVINDKGLPCSRSLTCKSHSMGAKRAVPGRCKPYDELLLEWQRIHNPALVAKLEEKERALAAAKAAAAERKKHKLLEKKKKKLARQGIVLGPDGQPVSAAQAAAAGGAAGVGANGMPKVQEDPNSDMYTLGFNDDQVDSELSDLVNAIRTIVRNDRTPILPMAHRSFAGMYTRRSHNLRGCRELLREGLRSAARASHAASMAHPMPIAFAAANAVPMALDPINGQGGMMIAAAAGQAP